MNWARKGRMFWGQQSVHALPPNNAASKNKNNKKNKDETDGHLNGRLRNKTGEGRYVSFWPAVVNQTIYEDEKSEGTSLYLPPSLVCVFSLCLCVYSPGPTGTGKDKRRRQKKGIPSSSSSLFASETISDEPIESFSFFFFFCFLWSAWSRLFFLLPPTRSPSAAAASVLIGCIVSGVSSSCWEKKSSLQRIACPFFFRVCVLPFL